MHTYINTYVCTYVHICCSTGRYKFPTENIVVNCRITLRLNDSCWYLSWMDRNRTWVLGQVLLCC